MRALLVVVLLTTLLGCNKQASLNGTWEGTHPGENGQPGGHSRITFSPDGKYVDVTTVSTGRGSGMVATDTGTWRFESEALRLTLQDVDWTFTGRPELVTLARQKFLDRKPEIIREHNAEPPAKVVWNGNDEFVITSYGVTTTYHRVR